MGIDSCRKIADSNTWSQHAWGNALDIQPVDRAQGDRIAAYLRSNGGSLNVGGVLWWVKDHYDHVHVEGMPKQTGTPPCAGGPKAALEKVPEGSGLPEWLQGAAAGSLFGVSGMIAGALTQASSPLDVAKTGLAVLTSPETYLRILWVVGGVFTLGAGVLMVAKELGAPIPGPAQVVKAGVSAATKGVL
jgi:hypothetical protein